MTIDKVVCRRHKAEIMRSSDIAFQTKHADVGILARDALVRAELPKGRSARCQAASECLGIVRREIAECSVVGCIHHAECIFAPPPRDLGRDVRIDDRTRVEDVEARLENIKTLEEERTFFGKENRKAK